MKWNKTKNTWYLLIELPIKRTESRILKNLRVVVIVDKTSGGKYRTVYKMNIWPMEEQRPNWIAYYK